MNSYLYDANDATRLVNQVKHEFVRALALDGVIDADWETIDSTYAIIIHEPSLLGVLWQRFFGDKKQEKGVWHISVVKRITPEVPQ